LTPLHHRFESDPFGVTVEFRETAVFISVSGDVVLQVWVNIWLNFDVAACDVVVAMTGDEATAAAW
jgi:hypothetical protein